ncbi:preprotein translocase subunit YidC [Azospirillum thiophilum]|uniref:Preprotein translocase YidC n=1 Tax=Azospirillum thiophilum TaxID=528244 RepID=A0AAC8W2S5_9PROT|nr:ABC transporter substrate-binding protein [Azospirillum thiophilum]ALG74055.1 preprotein translocase YidC [Azospirillum thiophilum]KJR63604.1 preprotein translocase subunit YidC [Azospirillum thiophilum]
MPIRLLLSLLLCLPTLALAQETRSFTDDLGRKVEVPAQPKRIVSVYDIDVTIPLIELGVLPVGSHGRIGPDGRPELRSSDLLTGVDFDTGGIVFIGATTVDLEAVVRLKPDLIVTEISRPTPVEQLAKIAPTVALDNRKGAPHLYRQLADLVHAQRRLAFLERRYRAQIERLRAEVDTGAITVSVLQPMRGKLSVYHSYRALGRVLRDAGFRFPALIDGIPENDRIEVGPERLPELDADIIFDPYRSDQGKGAAEEIALMNEVLPGFCDLLKACREGRYVMIPREEAISNSYAALSLMVVAVQSNLTRRPAAE